MNRARTFANLTRTSVHVNTALTNLALKYKFSPMVADRVFPVVPVVKEADVYYTFAREELIDYSAVSLRAPGTEAAEIEWDVSNETYRAEEYALKQLIPERVRANADPPIRPAMTTVQKLKRAILTGYERRIQAIVQSAVLITNNAGVGTAWDAVTGARIETDVDAAKEVIRRNIGIYPNSILMNTLVANAIKRWLKAIADTTYSEWLDKNVLPPTLWGLETIIGGGVRNSAAKGQTEVLADIWNDNVLVFYKEQAPSIEALTLGYTLRSREWRTKDWFDDKREGTFYEVGVVQDEVLVAESAGYLITDVLT